MANPGFFNDEAAIKMAQGKGCTIEEARDWTIVGCIQPGPGGRQLPMDLRMPGTSTCGKMLEFVLHDGSRPDGTGRTRLDCRPEIRGDFKNIEELKDALKKQTLHTSIELITGPDTIIMQGLIICSATRSSSHPWQPRDAWKPASLSSRAVPSTAQQACSSLDRPTWLIPAVAIEDVVYKDHDVTMDQLIEALDKNFEGEERLRQLLINKPPKYGNDNEYVDGVAREMSGILCRSGASPGRIPDMDTTLSATCLRP